MCNPRVTTALSALFAIFVLSPAYAQSEPGEGASDFFCQVNPSEKVDLASLVPGVLEKILADRGAHVTEGDPVFTLRSDIEQAEVALAEAKLKAVGQLQRAGSSVDTVVVHDTGETALHVATGRTWRRWQRCWQRARMSACELRARCV